MKDFAKIFAFAVSFMAILLIASCGGNDPFDSVTGPEAEGAEGFEEMAKPETGKPADIQQVSKVPVDNNGSDRIKVYALGRLADVFNDSNKYHYAVAEKLGIAPIADISQAFYTRRPIVKITSNQLYEVDELTHSLPFLVPEAAALLDTIARNFIDSLGSRGASGYRVRITSLLRTPASVSKLRRVNRNATDSSTHQFGTTFDLSYSRFHKADPAQRDINDGDLKNLLAEVLYDLRRRNKCLVKFERKSACFHVTATGL